MPINLPLIDITFYFVAYRIVKLHKNMAIFSLPKKYIFGNSNFTRAHIAQLVEHFHGKEEVVCSIHTVGTNIMYYVVVFKRNGSKTYAIIEFKLLLKILRRTYE